MTFNFSFHGLEDMSQLRELIGFLSKQDLGYPNYPDWVQRAEVQLINGTKSAILAFSDGHLVGNAIYQEYRELPGIIEIKNLRVHERVRQRGFARFLLSQVEAESSNHSAIICDARSDQRAIDLLLRSQGYEVLAEVHLYDSNALDRIYTKRFGSTPEGVLAPLRKTITG